MDTNKNKEQQLNEEELKQVTGGIAPSNKRIKKRD